jgi:hypothetical protein
MPPMMTTWAMAAAAKTARDTNRMENRSPGFLLMPLLLVRMGNERPGTYWREESASDVPAMTRI